MDKLVKIPGPDHPITIEPNARRVRVSWRGRVIADTRRALTLEEAPYPAVRYLPREDVDVAALSRSAHETYCPFKGDCSYFNLSDDDERLKDVAWSYENPFEAVIAIKDHLAFYADRVDIQMTSPER